MAEHNFESAYAQLMERFADAGPLDWTELLRRLEEVLPPMLEADGVAVLLGHADLPGQYQDPILRAYLSGLLIANPNGAALPLRELPWLETALQSKAALFVNEFGGEFARNNSLERELRAVGARAGLATPFNGGGLLGAALYYRSNSDPFTAEQVRLAETLAPLLQTVLRASFYYHEQRLCERHTDIIHDVSAETVGHIASPEQLYNRVCELIHQRFEFYDVAIFQVDWGERMMELAGHSGEYLEYNQMDYSQSVDTGNLGYAARTGLPRVVNDTWTDPQYYNPFPDNRSIRSELTIPIKAGDGHVLAALDIQSLEPNAFNRYQVASLEALCRMVAGIVQTVHRFEDMRMLQELGRQLQKKNMLDLNWLYHAVMTYITAGPGLGINRAVLFMLDEESRVLEETWYIGPRTPEEKEETLRSWSQTRNHTIDDYIDQGAPQEEREDEEEVSITDRFIRIPVDESDIESLLRMDGAVSLNREEEAPSRAAAALRQLSDEPEIAVIPLIAQDRLIGVVMADNSVTRRPIERRLLETLGAFASQAALALSNAQTYRELKNAFEELETAKDQAVENEKLAAVGKVTQYVAHEIRNPLTSIGGFAGRIRKTTEEENTRIYAKIIAREASQLERFLNEILYFSQSRGLDIKSTSIIDLVHEVECILAEMVSRSLSEKDPGEGSHEYINRMLSETNLMSDVIIDCKICEHDHSELEAQIDPDKIKQALLNLGRNAVEAMPEGGTLTFRVDVEGAFVRIDVEDTGIGIESGQIDQMFDLFHTTKKFGTGLGLKSVKDTIELHGGSIHVESEVGKGTVFIVRLPIEQPEKPEKTEGGTESDGNPTE